MPATEPLLAADEIQGHVLRGFDTTYLLLIGVKFGLAPAAARPWLRALGLQAHSLAAVHWSRMARTLRRQFVRPATAASPAEVYVNVALSFPALQQLGLSVAGIVDPLFAQPMGRVAGTLGDPLDQLGHPIRYVLGEDWANTPDVFLVIGSDSDEALALVGAQVLADAQAVGCTIIYHERGAKLPGETEHFGFRDGISQPGPRGRLGPKETDYLTPRYFAPTDPLGAEFAKPGQPLVWPGQFVFGYSTQRESSADPGAPANGGESWMINGSFLVFRRLRQDVAAFRAFINSIQSPLSQALARPVHAEFAAALLVGRWSDGSPLVAAPDAPRPELAGDPMAVNHFKFDNAASDVTVVENGATRAVAGVPADLFGEHCPFVAHIRKVNPRDHPTDQGSPGRTLQLQMLRRGIPYGPVFTPDTAGTDRGLLFLAFMTSIDGQFKVLNSQWMNNPNAPPPAEGHDLLVGQDTGGRFGRIRGPGGQAKLETLAQWVIPTGGAFLLAPSLSVLRRL